MHHADERTRKRQIKKISQELFKDLKSKIKESKQIEKKEEKDLVLQSINRDMTESRKRRCRKLSTSLKKIAVNNYKAKEWRRRLNKCNGKP